MSRAVDRLGGAARCSIVAGPPGEPRVDACSLLVTTAELQSYVATEAVDLALLVPLEEGVGYDLWVLSRSVEDDSYAVTRRETLRVLGEGLTFTSDTPEAQLLSADEVVELASRSVSHDLVGSKRIYEARACAEEDPRYPSAHTLVDLESSYAALLEQYEESPTWLSALDLFLFASLDVLTLGDVELLGQWCAMHEDLLATFGVEGGSALEGCAEELQAFADGVGDLLLVVRRILAGA
jgi:hypothetical protein